MAYKATWPSDTKMALGGCTELLHWFKLQRSKQRWTSAQTPTAAEPQTQTWPLAVALVWSIPWPQVLSLATQIDLAPMATQPSDTNVVQCGLLEQAL